MSIELSDTCHYEPDRDFKLPNLFGHSTEATSSVYVYTDTHKLLIFKRVKAVATARLIEQKIASDGTVNLTQLFTLDPSLRITSNAVNLSLPNDTTQVFYLTQNKLRINLSQKETIHCLARYILYMKWEAFDDNPALLIDDMPNPEKPDTIFARMGKIFTQSITLPEKQVSDKDISVENPDREFYFHPQTANMFARTKLHMINSHGIFMFQDLEGPGYNKYSRDPTNKNWLQVA